MLKRYHYFAGGLFRASDAIIICGVWILSYWLRFEVPLIEVTKGFPPFSTYAALLPLILVLWQTTFSILGLYQSKRMLRRTHEVHLVLKAHFLAMLLLISLSYFFEDYRYSRVVMGVFGTLGGILLVVSRLLIRNLIRELRRRGRWTSRVLAIGEGPTLAGLLSRLNRFPELGTHIVGFVSQEESKSELKNVKRLGTFKDTPTLIQSQRINELLIALPKDQYGELDPLLKSIRDETVDIHLVPDIHEYITLGCEVEDFEGQPIVHLNDSPMGGWGSLLKRVTDVLLSLGALLVFSPFLILISILIRLSSPGPILFRQTRMGLDGGTFEMIKFRTMRANAEKQTGAVWATENDQRKTRLGGILRATSLDELPQLWNVLKGEMSLVGPRPERPIFVDQFRNEIPHYMLRHKVKAGMTGWAQVNGWRGNTSISSRIEYDLYYIRNWSYILDLKILCMTVWKGFINKNAY